MTIKAVIFDLDDTLISERQYIESGYRHISKILANKINKNDKEIFNILISLFEKDSRFVFNRFFDKYGIQYTKEDIKFLVDEYRNHLPNIKFFNDVIPFLHWLKKNNIKTGIITDGYANAQWQKLKAIKACDYFDEIVVTDELGKEYWKPHPLSFTLIKDKLNICFNEMIYVGDNPEKDFFISYLFPVKTFRIIRENSLKVNKPYFKGIKEDYTIKNLYELSEFIF